MDQSNSILIDTGATAHILIDKNLFSFFYPNFIKENTYLELADGRLENNLVLGKGDAIIPLHDTSGTPCNIVLHNALYVPSFKHNILSHYHAVKDGLTFHLNSQGRECMHTAAGNIIKVNTKGNLYTLNKVPTNTVISRTAEEWHSRLGHCDVPDIMMTAPVVINMHIKESEKSTNCTICNTVVSRTAEEWHSRLGHCNIPDILKLPSIVDNMHIKRAKVPKECEICIQGKFTRNISRNPDERGTSPFQFVHVDLNGPIVEPNESEFSYVFGAICDYSQFISVYLIGNKSDSPTALLEYMSDIAPYGKISKLRSDMGKEFTSNMFHQILVNKEIRHETSAPYCPAMLGHIERAWRSLFNTARCLLYESGIPISLWPYAVKYAAYVRNRCYQQRIKCTPLEKATNRRPDFSKIELFGGKVYMYVQHKKKLEPRATLGVFLGYHPNSPAKYVYDPDTGAVHQVNDVKFLENMYFKPKLNNTPAIDSEPTSRTTEVNTGTTNHGNNGRESEDFPIATENNITQNCDMYGRVGDTPCLTRADTTPDTNAYNLRRRATVDYQYYLNENYVYNRDFVDPSCFEDLSDETIHSIFNIRLEQNLFSNFNYFSCLNVDHTIINVPNSYKQAMKSPQRKFWIIAMHEEIQSLIRTGTFSCVRRPQNCDIVGGRWVYSVKVDPDGNLRFKARYVAKGYTQIEGLNYNDTYAPTARLTSVRMLISIVVQNDFLIHHVDVNNAYLHSELDYEIYMSQPEGYVQDPNMVWRLNKSIYGLKQSAAMWHSTLLSFMKSQNMTQSICDPCVFRRITKSSTLIVLIWVDDCIIAASDIKTLNAFKRNFGQTFRTKDLGDLSFFLGIQFNIEKNVITMNQKLYIQNILKRFNEYDSKPKSTPCDPSIYEMLKPQSPKLENPTEYRAIVGSLIYLLTGTRPDIAFVVTLLSRFMNKPLKIHMLIARGVLKYLKGTLDFDLKYIKSDTKLAIYGYSDSDYAQDSDRQSVSGYVFKCSPQSALISWRSGKQTLVASSSCEAEYIALHAAVCEALFLRMLYAEFTLKPTQTVHIYVDNMGCICLAKHPSYHNKTKHIDVKFHAIRKYVANKAVSISYISTKDNIADLCTKALRGPALRSFSIIRGILPYRLAK